MKNIVPSEGNHSLRVETHLIPWAQRMAPVLIILAGICWGIIGLFSRNLSQAGLNSLQITASRCIVTAVSLVLFLLVKDREKLRIKIKDLWIFFGTGVCSIVFFNICYFTTIKMATLSVASILLYTAPCFVMIMSAFFFKERITLRKVGALILAFGGCILITGIIGSSEASISGLAILTGLGAGFGYALYSIFGSIALKKYHPFTVTAYTFIVASLSLLPFSEGYGLLTLTLHKETVLINVVLLGIMSTLIPFLLYTKGLEHMEAGKASVMAFIEPMVATLVGIFIFSEGLSAANMTGIGLIFLSVLILNLKTRQALDS